MTRSEHTYKWLIPLHASKINDKSFINVFNQEDTIYKIKYARKKIVNSHENDKPFISKYFMND